MTRPLALLLLLLLASASPASAATVIGWLGDGTGHFEGARVPTVFSATEGVRWSVALPSWGNASPIVVGDRVCVTSEPTMLLCFQASTGRELWRHSAAYLDTVSPAERESVGREFAETQRLEKLLAERSARHATLKRSLRKRHGDQAAALAEMEALTTEVSDLRDKLLERERYREPEPIAFIGSASATPVSDGRAIYGVFGNGVVVGLDLSGKLLWGRYLGRPVQIMKGYHRGQAASPRLIDGTLVVGFNALYGLDPATGAVRWRGDDYRDFGAPTGIQVGGRWFVVTPSGAIVRVSDGEHVADAPREVWYTSPAPDGDTLYYVGAGVDPQSLDRRAWAVRLRPDGAGLSVERRWDTGLTKGKTYACPHVHGGILYGVALDGTLAALNADTGELFYEERVDLGPGDALASIVSAGDTLLLGAEDGTIARIEAGPTLHVLGTHQLAGFRSTPFLTGGVMYVRALDRLWALGE
ncbi:MAG: PQQ-binding-like beta-propeller repeat protein [Deltaproteobacteria bacterium]|nr:PQQ-binding-like beta-propeller repeat protein [Deltaproteobacteria bacterium]